MKGARKPQILSRDLTPTQQVTSVNRKRIKNPRPHKSPMIGTHNVPVVFVDVVIQAKWDRILRRVR